MPQRRFVLVLALALVAAALTVAAAAVLVSFALSATRVGLLVPLALVVSLLLRAAWR